MINTRIYIYNVGYIIICIILLYTVGRRQRKTVTMGHGAICPKVSQLFTLFLFNILFILAVWKPATARRWWLENRKSLISTVKCKITVMTWFLCRVVANLYNNHFSKSTHVQLCILCIGHHRIGSRYVVFRKMRSKGKTVKLYTAVEEI